MSWLPWNLGDRPHVERRTRMFDAPPVNTTSMEPPILDRATALGRAFWDSWNAVPTWDAIARNAEAARKGATIGVTTAIRSTPPGIAIATVGNAVDHSKQQIKRTVNVGVIVAVGIAAYFILRKK